MNDNLVGNDYRDLLKEACDRNIVVYDANSDDFSIRLIHLMKICCRRNNPNNCRLDRIITNEKYFFNPKYDMLVSLEMSDVSICGVKIVYTEEDLSVLYEKHGCSFYKSKRSMLLGIAEDEQPILGTC